MWYHFIPVMMAIVKKIITAYLRIRRKWDLLCSVGGNANWYSHYGKQLKIWEFKKLKLQAYIHNEILYSLKKKENPAMCNNMNDSGRHYDKWNKPDGKRKILVSYRYGILKKKNKNVDLIETE